MTKLCAEAMGYSGFRYYGDCDPGYECATVKEIPAPYWPLRDDAQAMALVKKLGLTIDPEEDEPPFTWRVCAAIGGDWDSQVNAHGGDLNRAIVECAATLQAAKTLHT